MAGNSFGELFRITTWGESHGRAIGVVVDGCPAGLALSAEDIQHDLNRRRVGQSRVTSPRQEEDQVEILSGVFQGRTLGTPISLLMWNKDADSSKYEPIKDIYRPGHADFTYELKYGIRDYRGGGRSSARETACRVAAAAIAKKLLSTIGVRIYGFTRQVGAIEAQVVEVEEIERNPVRCPDREAAKQMEALILAAKAEGDSVGGIVEVVATGVPVGLGDPVYDRLDADLAKAVMSINAIKGVEIGLGFRSITLRGSEHNDEFYTDASGRIRTRTNHAGGMLGGISNGEDLIIRLAVKPPSSISKTQRSVTTTGAEVDLEVHGRHDPCLCPRAVPVAEAMVALVLADHWLRDRAMRPILSDRAVAER
ncbi:MAG TPA: chorismate synthase [Alphaproteobacteria bacterium]|nr:chorismate synthase [Alphaproteobacteria bacterium]